jgi:hypothetical protein
METSTEARLWPRVLIRQAWEPPSLGDHFQQCLPVPLLRTTTCVEATHLQRSRVKMGLWGNDAVHQTGGPENRRISRVQSRVGCTPVEPSSHKLQ